jgi:cobalt-zinc-cadmium efflux system outer membrane protein
MDRSAVIASTLGLALASLLAGRTAEGQSRVGGQRSSPTLDASALGTAPGASPGQNRTIYGGPPGASPGRYQPALTSPPTPNPTLPLAIESPAPLPARDVVWPRPPTPGLVEPPGENLWVGREGGITLDEAIDRLCRCNLELRTQFSEIPQAEADAWTASLRSNPILYADSQQVPYGQYSSKTVGGPLQYDINVVYPIDWSGKRPARTRAAELARYAVMASYRDAVRLTIDNLYQAYVDALVAQSNYEQTRPKGPGAITDLAATISVDEPKSALEQTQRTLALLLDMPFEEVAGRGLLGRLVYFQREEVPLPPLAELVGRALAGRPDVLTQRLAVEVAEANVKAVKANRFEDVLLLYQPFTAHEGRPFGLKDRLSWTIGVTVPLPVYNRQQGNLMKAGLVADQARTKLASVLKTVDAEVHAAVLEHEAAHQAIKRTYDDFSKAVFMKARVEVAKAQLPSPAPGTAGNDPNALLGEALAAVQSLGEDSYDDKGRKYKEAVARHRRSMLRLNTTVGERVMP